MRLINPTASARRNTHTEVALRAQLLIPTGCFTAKAASPHIKAFNHSAVLGTRTSAHPIQHQSPGELDSLSCLGFLIFSIETGKTKTNKRNKSVVLLFLFLFVPKGLDVSAQDAAQQRRQRPGLMRQQLHLRREGLDVARLPE